MINDVDRLYQISKKNTRTILGLMSGTSLDGLDIALCDITGSGTEVKAEIRKFKTVPYTEDFKGEIRQVFAKDKVSLQQLCLLNEWIGITHAEMINSCLQQWNIKNNTIDLIASHGQTIYHAPAHQHKLKKFPNGTLQIGDGDHIAASTGIITLSDFRQKHVAKGGEGAPLAAYGDILLFSDKNANVVLLNIGGIANLTFLPAEDSAQTIFCSDIGPGNTLMDAWMQKEFAGSSFDKDAMIASHGIVNNELITALNDHPFFSLPFPKTTGPEVFNLSYLEAAINSAGTNLSKYDIMATLNAFTATVIVKCLKEIRQEYIPMEIYVSGGGMHNPLLMKTISDNISAVTIHTTAEKDIDPDAKEALLFALLANEAICAKGEDYAKGFPAISMGKISFPS